MHVRTCVWMRDCASQPATHHQSRTSVSMPGWYVHAYSGGSDSPLQVVWHVTQRLRGFVLCHVHMHDVDLRISSICM